MIDFNFKIDENLTNFKTVCISIPKSSIKSLSDFTTIPEQYIKDRANREFNHHLVKFMTNYLLESEELDLIDLSDELNYKQMNCISECVYNNKNYKNIITSTKIGSFFQDSYNFYAKEFNKISYNDILLYKIGSYYELNIYVSSIAGWSFDKICFFNEVNINIKDSYEESEDCFKYYFYFDIYIKDFKVVYIRFDKQSESYKEYLSIMIPKNREDIINKIL